MDKVPEGYTPDQPLECSAGRGCPGTDLAFGIILTSLGLVATMVGGVFAGSKLKPSIDSSVAPYFVVSGSVVAVGTTLLFSSDYGYGYAAECEKAKKLRQEWLIIDAKKKDKTKQPELRTWELINKGGP